MKRVYTDILRVGLLMVVSGAVLLYMDRSNIVIIQALLIEIFLVGGTHLTRRILFPRLDLQAIAIQAIKEKNYAALGVFATIVGFIVAVIHVSLSVLK